MTSKESQILLFMHDTISLSQLKKGDKAKITSFVNNHLPAKFFELGIVPGATIEIKHKAPMQGPICVNITQNDTLIAIRNAEAETILIDRL